MYITLLGLAFLIAEESLEKQLSAEDPASLARAARLEGDPIRGALIFHQPNLTCARCHLADDGKPIGPDLAGEKLADAYIVESLLQPAKALKKGYETITLLTKQGKTLTGLLVEERADALLLRDAAQDFRIITIAKDALEERVATTTSLMPAGLVNQLGSRQQFLDLVRYLIEISEKGPVRARELRPDPSLIAQPVLPEYEKNIDHAGMIAGLNQQNFRRGEAIYQRLCVNCHGTKDEPGSLPTSPRFAFGTFKNGSDPHSMYRTLTHGLGLMTPQTWMVPRQKYDVIHYIREAYLKPYNPAQYAALDRAYLDRLPKGTSRGPEPTNVEPWAIMNYGPSLIGTYEIGTDETNFAYKGIAIRLDNGPGGVARGRQWIVYDHDTLRVAGAWSGEGFIDWNCIQFNGKHAVHPRLAGTIAFTNPPGAGWANPDSGSFDDVRLRGRDGKPYGPLPRSWAHYKGLYHFGHQVILSYSVAKTDVLEMPGMAEGRFTRTFNIGYRERELVLQVARDTAVGMAGQTDGMVLADGKLRIPPGGPVKFTVWMARMNGQVTLHRPDQDLSLFTQGGPPRWPEKLTTTVRRGNAQSAFQVDTLAHPENNPWLCQMRFSGLDFFPDGKRLAVAAWDGDVWLVSGIERADGALTWQRIASGLFQPLGLRIVDGQIYVGCRDQIVLLRDLNGDGEADFYENFNSDHQVTEHFHEFAMGLQTDAVGNFYYAKAARHARTALVPQHGTLLRVSKDGSRTDILARGFRAPNGVCLNDDGSFFLTDQEGHWTPKNRINWVRPGRFYGNMWGYTDITDTSSASMEQPLCWITNTFDRSPSELLWVQRKEWGPLHGALLNFSYGYGKVYVVLREKLQDGMQGGMCALPIPQFPTGVMRGRFHPDDGQLYCCGMFSWAGSQTQPGGLYRMRYTGQPLVVPIELKARRTGIEIAFTGELDIASTSKVENYAVKTWSLKRSVEYGSKHHDEKALTITGIELSEDRKRVLLKIASLTPTQCMEIKYFLRSTTGAPVEGAIHNTIHVLQD